jgi:hypothetical protein
MTDDTDAPAVLAEDVFHADLRPRPGGRVLSALRLAGAFGAQLLQQLVPSPSVHDVVVTRRSDGAEVLREPAGDPLSAGDMVAGIRRDLATLDPDTFLAQWESRTGS